MIRTRSVAIVVIAWTLGASTAIVVGLLALSLIGTGFAEGSVQTLVPDAAGLSAPEPTPDTGAPSPSGSPAAAPTTAVSSATGAGVERLFKSAGGSVVARCGAAGAYLVYWSPAQGFRADGVTRGPAATVRVSFESKDREVKMSVSCVNGNPKVTIREDEQTHDGSE